jgi:hypothetical protein
VVANLVIAATFITVLVLRDLIGTLPLPLGVAGHEGSTVIVGLNGLRLLRRPPGDLPPASSPCSLNEAGPSLRTSMGSRDDRRSKVPAIEGCPAPLPVN